MIKKFNEMFKPRKASKDTIDILNPLLKKAVGDIYEKKNCAATHNNNTEVCDSISDAVDYILESIKFGDKIKYKIVDLDTYLTLDVSPLAKDYGFNGAYIVLPSIPKKDSKMELLVSDDKYISGIKSKFYKNPVFIGGVLNWGKKYNKK